MILEIVKYGHPVLRQKGARLEQITPEISQLISDMLETMRDAHGVGLAAQQVGHALQLAVLDVRDVTDRPSSLELHGQPAEVETFMPMVLVNPELRPLAEPVTGAEGCLSFPEIYSEISRPESIEVKALDAKGTPLHFRCGGLLARAIQHEYDHLQGILFIDRMNADEKSKVRPQLEDLQTETKLALKKNRR